MKHLSPPLAALFATTALLLSGGLQAQSNAAASKTDETDLGSSNVAPIDATALLSGLSVNEIRIRGRRDGVEVRRKSGGIDYYSDTQGLYSNDAGTELGNHSALRIWRFGN